VLSAIADAAAELRDAFNRERKPAAAAFDL